MNILYGLTRRDIADKHIYVKFVQFRIFYISAL